MYTLNTVALAIAPLALLAQAVDFDISDAPTSCKTICGPLGELSNKCDIDLRSDIDRDERLLENQCICTNKSFDVAKFAALCADCMHQSASNKKRQDNDDDDDDDHRDRADRDDIRDIDNLMSTCGFSSTQYNPSVTGEVQSITVAVTKPTDISQLTTTLTGGNAPVASSSSSSSSSSQSTSSGASPVTSGTQTTGSQTSGSQTSSSSSPTDSDNAAGSAAANIMYYGGAAIAGGMLLL